MSNTLCHAGITACAKLATPGLRRACLAHRASVLEAHLAKSRRSLRCTGRNGYVTSVSNDASLQIDDGESGNFKSKHGSPTISRYAMPSGEPVHKSVKVLDPYLPLELRSGTWLENLAEFEGVRDSATLANALRSVNANFKPGALTSLALEQGRWAAFLYLSEALIRQSCREHDQIEAIIREDNPWLQQDATFPNIYKTRGKISFDTDGRNDQTGKTSTASLSEIFEEEASIIMTAQDGMGFLWQALGQIVLQAADSDREMSEYMMSHVHQVFSTLHNEGQMDPRIYQFDSEEIPKIYRKSPFLHLMSSRIMTVVSDSTWKANEDQIIESYTWMGAAYASSGGVELKDLYPAVRTIGPETWLELILWSCVLGGHTRAGSQILSRIASRTGQRRWHSISWNALVKHNLKNTDPANARKLDERFNRIAGGHEGYSRDAPVIDLPEKTISSEVVVALIDSMAAASTGRSSKMQASDIATFKTYFQSLVPYAEKEFWSLVATRSVDFAEANPELQPQIFQHVSEIISTNEVSINEPESTSFSIRKHDMAPFLSSSLRSIHQKAFTAWVNLGRIHDALRAFARLQDWLDAKKRYRVNQFFSMKRQEFQRLLEEGGSEIADTTPMEQYRMPIPVATSAKFLDLLRKNGLLEFGSWLLSSRDADGPVISEAVRNSPVFQPALLRFAIATTSQELVQEVSRRAEANEQILTDDFYHSLFQAHVTLHRFDSAETILNVIRSRKFEPVSSEDVMTLARQILVLETNADKHSRDNLQLAGSLLTRILSREFLPRPKANLPLDLNNHYELNQLCYVLESVDGALSSFAEYSRKATGRLFGRMQISASAFNILLQGVVEAQGMVGAKTLFERWCVLPALEIEELPEHSPNHIPIVGSQGPEEDGVVFPTALTVCTVVQPLLEKAKRYKRIKSPNLKPSEQQSNTTLAETENDEGREERGPLVRIREDLSLSSNDLAVAHWTVDTLQKMGLTQQQIMETVPEILANDNSTSKRT